MRPRTLKPRDLTRRVPTREAHSRFGHPGHPDLSVRSAFARIRPNRVHLRLASLSFRPPRPPDLSTRLANRTAIDRIVSSPGSGDLGRTNRRGPSPPTTPMRAMSAELSSTAAACGLPERLLGYLKDKRVLSVGLLAAMVDSYKEIDELLYQPLLDGTEIEGHEWKIDPEEGPVVRAALRFLWKQCRDKESQAGTSSGDPSQGPGIPSTNPGMGITDGTNTKPAPNVPREIPPPELQKLLKYYADTEIAGRHRDFPMRALVGAERVMARIWHERWISNQFTPTQLHEILESRCFDSSGSLNTLNKELKQKAQSRLTIDEEYNTIVVEEEQQWSPKGLLSLMDALEAIELCWTLCQLGHELDIKDYISWWRQLFRSRPGKIEQLKAYWLDGGWRIVLLMRQGHSFAHCTQTLMDDTGALQAALMKELPVDNQQQKKPPTRPNRYKGKGGGKQDRTESSSWTSSQSSQDRPWKREWPQWKANDSWQTQPWKRSSAGTTSG